MRETWKYLRWLHALAAAHNALHMETDSNFWVTYVLQALIHWLSAVYNIMIACIYVACLTFTKAQVNLNLIASLPSKTIPVKVHAVYTLSRCLNLHKKLPVAIHASLWLATYVEMVAHWTSNLIILMIICIESHCRHDVNGSWFASTHLLTVCIKVRAPCIMSAKTK